VPSQCATGRGFRHAGCAAYCSCLAVAALRTWSGFTCAGCPQAAGVPLVDIVALDGALPSWVGEQLDGDESPMDLEAGRAFVGVTRCPRCRVDLSSGLICNCHFEQSETSVTRGLLLRLDEFRSRFKTSSCRLCDEPVRAQGLCSRHYQAARRTSNPHRCSAPDCDSGVKARGLCSKHYMREFRAERRQR